MAQEINAISKRTITLTTPYEYVEENGSRFEDELCELLRIPSVSADRAHRDDVGKAADWMVAQFQRLGMDVQRIETSGHPIVYAEWLKAPNAPTALIYGHYDVQPPDPLQAWISPPFEPTRRDGNLYARGATDDKGQMLTHVKSAEAWLKTEGRLPINLKFLIEGEEETGSEHLFQYIANHHEQLRAEVAVISDTGQFAPGQPAITYGLRGICYYELNLRGPARNLHSGSFGGAVVNPANTLARMLTALIDEEGKIQVPGFYEDIEPISAEERRRLASLPFDERAFMKETGSTALGGETGFSTLERRWIRPSYDVNGVWGGYQGEGAKTVLPAEANAKFSFRLVPRQDPEKITAALQAMLESLCPAGIQMKLSGSHGAPGVVVRQESPFMQAAADAIEKGFGRRPVLIREGGSIPVVSVFHEQLGLDTLLLGWGLEDDNTHAPNEKFCLADFHRGIRASTHLWEELRRVVAGEHG